MPSGKVHHRLWKIGWIVEGVAFMPLLLYYPLVAIGSAIGYFLGQFIDPDLDLVGITSAEGRMLRKMPFVGGLFVAYWTLYGAIFRKQHRSFWTHSYIASTIIRFAYTFWWLLLFKSLPVWLYSVMPGVFVGMCISDGVHIWADRKYGGK